MARRQSKEQKETIERVMHEFKHGELRIRGSGPKVKNPKQAVAIALHEAGASNQESPKKNRENLKRTKAKERRGETAQARARGRRQPVIAPAAERPRRTSTRKPSAATSRAAPGCRKPNSSARFSADGVPCRPPTPRWIRTVRSRARRALIRSRRILLRRPRRPSAMSRRGCPRLCRSRCPAPGRSRSASRRACRPRSQSLSVARRG